MSKSRKLEKHPNTVQTLPVFKTIDLTMDFPLCQQFRALSYQASFGHLEGFDSMYGDSYRDRLSLKIQQAAFANNHVYVNNQIVGQTEGKLLPDSEIGYINLLVLLPQFRGQGIGTWMVEALADEFLKRGRTRLQLSVSQKNEIAQGFYFNNGWACLGPRAEAPDMLLMQKTLR